MIFTLHRYIFRELFKVFLLATLALTLIMSLGSILLPVQDYGLGPRHALHLMAYFLPITLTFVLPIAALFASALVYGRFASDNELDACKASGISFLTLVYPGLALAIMVAIANLVLNFHVTPVFVQMAEKSIKADAKQILFRNIKRRGYYKLLQDERWYMLYADYANSQNDTLSGVVIAEGETDRVKKITTVDTAKVEFDPNKRFNEVRITARNTYQISSEDNIWFSSAEWGLFSREFGSLLADDIKFKKIREMKMIQADPMRFDPIAEFANRTYAQFSADLLMQDITAKVSGDTNSFYSLYSGDKFVEFTAKNCTVKDKKQIELSEGVVVKETNIIIEGGKVKKLPFRTLRCEKALLHIEGEDSSSALTIAMELYSPTWQHVDGQKGVVIGRLRIAGLILPVNVDIRERFETEYVLEAIQKASKSSILKNEPSTQLQKLQHVLQRSIRKTLAEISAELHSRLVFGFGCIFMILIGIGLGVVWKGGHLLSAFAASCVPAVVLIVCIMCGRNITQNLGSQGVSGIVLMWSGLGFLMLLSGVIYYRLLKN
jgi:lipopolysaccharide export system permease protein